MAVMAVVASLVSRCESVLWNPCLKCDVTGQSPQMQLLICFSGYLVWHRHHFQSSGGSAPTEDAASLTGPPSSQVLEHSLSLSYRDTFFWLLNCWLQVAAYCACCTRAACCSPCTILHKPPPLAKQPSNPSLQVVTKVKSTHSKDRRTRHQNELTPIFSYTFFTPPFEMHRGPICYEVLVSEAQVEWDSDSIALCEWHWRRVNHLLLYY